MYCFLLAVQNESNNENISVLDDTDGLQVVAWAEFVQYVWAKNVYSSHKVRFRATACAWFVIKWLLRYALFLDWCVPKIYGFVNVIVLIFSFSSTCAHAQYTFRQMYNIEKRFQRR